MADPSLCLILKQKSLLNWLVIVYFKLGYRYCCSKNAALIRKGTLEDFGIYIPTVGVKEGHVKLLHFFPAKCL